MNREDAEAWLTLQFLPGLGCGRIAQLLAACGSVHDILARRAGNASLPGFARLLEDERALSAARDEAEKELERVERKGVTLLSCVCPEYPPQLRAIPDRPFLLYLRGDAALLSSPMLAMVGNRGASDYGLRTARRFAAAAAERGVTVVSGAAYGIDAAAHEGALEAGGPTIAVLGCGVDVVYPAPHRRLLDEIAEKGALVSEFPLGTRPDAFRFPVRNRIISGLSRAVLVVEAGDKSGSLITARLGLDQGREVMAVPGSIDSPKSDGAHRLIQQGALLVRRPEDIFEALDWSDAAWSGVRPVRRDPAEHGPAEAPPREAPPPDDLPPSARQVLQALDAYPADIDTLALRCGLPLTDLQALLLGLELEGRLRRLPGNLYERI